MPVRFFFVDESYDSNKYCLSAISIRDDDWKDCFEKIKEHRQNLKNDHGIFIRKEIHAHELVSGRGRIADVPVGKWLRSRIYYSMLNLVASLPRVWVFNVCLDTTTVPETQMKAWDRLINRIERTLLEAENKELPLRRKLISEIGSQMSANTVEKIESRLRDFKARAVIFADEGREKEITKAIRRMHVVNYIPSQFGQWSDGRYSRNITTNHLIEDPIFKKSDRSYLIQLADCVAFGLLKREVDPTPNISKYKIEQMFETALAGVCYKACSPQDPLGIVRN